MRDSIPWLLWCWPALSLVLFRMLPGRDAAIACLVTGWALLPVELYPTSIVVDGEPSSSVQAVAVPTHALVNKANAIGLGCLAGFLLFDRRTFGRLRLDPVDLPILAFCLVPLASTVANRIPVSEGLAQVRHLALAWGVPYLMGRAYLADADSQGRFAVGLAAGGLAYLPLCLLEIVAGPTAYRIVYGPHPYEFEGSTRFLSNRPLGFLEHGNQLGMWMAGSALVTTWIWASGAVKRPGGLPGGPLSVVLIVATLLCQSHGAILLLALALIPLLLARYVRIRISWSWALTLALGLVLLGTILLAIRRGFDLRTIRLEVVDLFKGINKKSFTWRLARSLDFLPMAWQRPWLGWGQADWRPDGQPFVNPVNLSIWLLALGMYGVVGLSALITTWLLPLARSARAVGDPTPFGAAGGTTGALLALVTIHFLDGFSNAVVILPVLAAVGGLNRPITRKPIYP